MTMTMEPVLTPFCHAENFDPVTNTCSAVSWGPYQGALPPLPADDALIIAAGIIACWAVGFKVRAMKRVAR